jgi:methylated-DNA-[protein]-cysteine S-methyltransferase
MHRLLRLHAGPHSLNDGLVPKDIVRALTNYFAGDLLGIDMIRVASGGTEFQRDMWSKLRGIPAGTTSTYGVVAAQLGRPRARRAVGAANGANPIAIVVPCHRVIGANGELTGYGGGIERKRWLLDHERLNTMTSDVIA